MKVIGDRDLGIVCDSFACTSQAYYVCTVHLPESADKPATNMIRLYCPQCTAILLQGAAKLVKDDAALHDYVETEHLLKGEVIEA